MWIYNSSRYRSHWHISSVDANSFYFVPTKYRATLSHHNLNSRVAVPTSLTFEVQVLVVIATHIHQGQYYNPTRPSQTVVSTHISLKYHFKIEIHTPPSPSWKNPSSVGYTSFSSLPILCQNMLKHLHLCICYLSIHACIMQLLLLS